MTSELYENFPPVKELIEQLRNRVMPDLLKTPELYYDSDVKRLKENDLYAHKYIAHQTYLQFPGRKIAPEAAIQLMKEHPRIMDKTVEMVKDDLRWRKEFGVRDIKRSEFPSEYFDREGCYIYNEDVEGRTNVVLRVRRLRKTKPGEKALGERFVIYWIEHVYQRNEKGINIILDCADAGLSNVNMDLVHFAHFIFKQHYPCFLGYFLVYNMPWIFGAVWNVIKRFLPKAAVERIKFVDNKAIQEYIDENKLPREMGGTDTTPFYYDICPKEKDICNKEIIHTNLETVSIDL